MGAASFGTVCIGLYGLWHNADFEKDFEAISCDLGFVISNDGLRFREPVKGHQFLTRHESPASPVPGKNYNTNLCQGNGILNVGDETRIYHGRYRNQEWRGDAENVGEDYRGEVGLATLPRDRWGALGLFPDQSSGHVWTAPIVLPTGPFALTLNADGVQGMRVEIGNERSELLPEYSGRNAGVSTSDDGFDCEVNWANSTLTHLAGQTIRFKIHLQTGDYAAPRLYAATLLA